MSRNECRIPLNCGSTRYCSDFTGQEIERKTPPDGRDRGFDLTQGKMPAHATDS